jgi:hypothetical protein
MQPDKQQQALARLKELHAQSIPFIEARDILLKEGFTSLEIINGAYLFNRSDPNENPTLEQQNLNIYMKEHPETADELVATFSQLETEHETTDKEAQSIDGFGRHLQHFIEAGYVTGFRL